MKKAFILLNLIVISYISTHGNNYYSELSATEHVKNIILLIGDGMGTTQIYAGLTANKGNLNLNRAKVIGFSKTYSASSYTTDSGAGGTAISSGYKTNNYSIGIDKEGIPHKTILEIAENSGLSTGVVVTSSVTHATPASFVTHVNNRFSEEAIAEQYLHKDIDIIIGGGRKFFNNRSDSINLFDSLRSEDYLIVNNLQSIDTVSGKNICCLAAENSLESIQSGRGDFLSEGTSIALKKLNKNENGFFIMIEGSQIDWGGHDNNIEYVTSEVIDFDKAVGVAFDFADRNPGTLVIVTADHETGGLAIIDGDFSKGVVNAKFSCKHHTGVMVPVFAYGTCASTFAGIYENTEIFHKMVELIGIAE
jgi:alkaline phosphatase